MSRLRWLAGLEYTSVFAAVGGAIASILTEQVLWVTCPLVITVGIQSLNRRQQFITLTELSNAREAEAELIVHRLNHIELQLQHSDAQQQAILHALDNPSPPQTAPTQNAPVESDTPPESTDVSDTPPTPPLDMNSINQLMGEIRSTIDKLQDPES